ncbi:hypothetical protein DFJ73DRAFT_963390 [Zopfochytrium polystomum]|nr:hypothetical protein DFJ73DRAFT_963390 [Zopfochytrium polystomum]
MAEPFLAPAYHDDPAASDSINQMHHCNHCGAPVSAADKKHRPQAAAAAFTTTPHPHSLFHHHHPHYHPAAIHAKRRKARLVVLSVFTLVLLGGAIFVSRTAHRIHNELRELREAAGLGGPAFGAGMPGFAPKYDEIEPCHDADPRHPHPPGKPPGHPHPPGKPPGRRPHPHPHPPKPSPPDEGEEPPESPPDDGEEDAVDRFDAASVDGDDDDTPA